MNTQSKKRSLGIAALAVIATIFSSSQASALWVSSANIVRVRQYASGSSYRLDVWFSVDVASGCTDNRKASIITTDAAYLEGIRDIALAAHLSGRSVEINTVGCAGGNGKIDYISLNGN
jgi:hypothetical protein